MSATALASSAAEVRPGTYRHRVLTAVMTHGRTVAELAEETGLSSKQVRRAIGSLKSRRLVYQAVGCSSPEAWWISAAGLRVLRSSRGDR